MSTERGLRIIELSRSMEQMALERSQLLAAFDSAHEYDAFGSPNSVAFLKTHCRLSVADAMAAMSVARRLPELPRIETAVASGEIGFSHAAVIAESAERLGSDLLLDRQEELVVKAEEVDPSRLR
jgi:hypothetical protein